MRKIWIIIISLFLCSCSVNNEIEEKQKQQQNNVIQEYNRLGNDVYEQVDQAQAQSLAYLDKLMDLCLYNKVDKALEPLFYSETSVVVKDVEAQNEGEYKTFWDLKCVGESVDAYDTYLTDYAKRKGIAVSDVYTQVQQWEKLETVKQKEKMGTLDDYSDFFGYDSTVTHHDYYVRMGNQTVQELIIVNSKYAEQLTIIITWQDGQIRDLVRMFKK